MGWDVVAGTVLTNFVLPVLTAVALGLVGVLLAKARTKFNLSINADMESAIMKETEVLVRAAEEKMANAVSKGTAKITGQQGMAEVVSALITKFPALTPDQATKYGNAVVHLIPGVGASG